MIHRLIVPLMLAVLVARADPALAQGNGGTALPPFPSGGAPPIAGGGAGGGLGSPPGAAPGLSEACRKDFVALRDEAEKRGKLIKEARERQALPEEACKLIASFSQAEVKMIEYVEANTAKCGIPSQVADQLKSGHKSTVAMQTKACNVADDPAMKRWRE